MMKKITFKQRPIPIPADYRPLYKISIVVLILKICCRGEQSRLLKLHLLSWAVSNRKNRSELHQYISSNFSSEFSVWGIEPALNRALQLAVAENICEINQGKYYKLTEKGDSLYKKITADTELMDQEKDFFGFIGKNKITDSRISTMTKQWNINYD